MKKLLLSFTAVVLPLVIPTAFALDFTFASLPYSDVEATDPYALPISVLTAEGYVQGNPDGSFAPNRLLNRAEFLKMIIGMQFTSFTPPKQPCFPDVDPEAWYATFVCLAFEKGIVAGYPAPAGSSAARTFMPEKNVNYAEALKMLSEAFDEPVEEGRGDSWFEPYRKFAIDNRISLPESPEPGSFISRGQMTELAARFLAKSQGELDQYMDAIIAGPQPSSSSSSAQSSEEEPPASVPPLTYPKPTLDPLPTDFLNLQHIPTNPLPTFDSSSHILLLGAGGQTVSRIKVTPILEPVQIRQVRVKLRNRVDSVASFEIMDEFGFIVGTATLDTAASSARDTFILTLNADRAYYIGKSKEIVFAARVRTRGIDDGGISGEILQVQEMTVRGIGHWSNREQLVEIRNESINFQKHQTAVATISSIRNAGNAEGVLATGAEKILGTFTIVSEQIPSSAAAPALQELRIALNASPDVTITNVLLRANDSDEKLPCTLAGASITCSNIPGSIGNIEEPRTLSVYGDITVSAYIDPFLSLELNVPGRPDSPGDITWTDGVSTLEWIPLDQPVAQGTSWQ